MIDNAAESIHRNSGVTALFLSAVHLVEFYDLPVGHGRPVPRDLSRASDRTAVIENGLTVPHEMRRSESHRLRQTPLAEQPTGQPTPPARARLAEKFL